MAAPALFCLYDYAMLNYLIQHWSRRSNNALPTGPDAPPASGCLRRDLVFCLVTLAACFALWHWNPFPVQHTSHLATIRQRARVTAIDNSHVRVNLIVKTQTQFLTVRLLSGPHKGAELAVENYLTGKLELDECYEPGDTVLVEYQLKDGLPAHPYARGHYRLRAELLLIVLFAALLILLAGLTGIKAILSFIFTVLMLWKVLFPALLKGIAPVPLGLSVVAAMTAVVTFSVGGLSRRGVAAFAGSMLGLLLTAGLAARFASVFRLHGAVVPFAETLLYSGYLNLNLMQVFIASIFVSSSGAVMDLSMDIAVAMEEVQSKKPGIGVWEHLRSGLHVGQAVLGTMTTTLLLAYSGSHITMFMFFLSKGLPMDRILNLPMVAAEILNILVGSFGLATVAPFTALVAALLFRSPRSVRELVPAGERPANPNTASA
jgi:uncharacterized membrane protein